MKDVPAPPALRASAVPGRALRRWWGALGRLRRGSAEGTAVTALSLDGHGGAAAVRVARRGDGSLAVQQAGAGELAALRGWARAGWLRGADAVLVLPMADRHVLTIDDPEVDEADRAMAARLPLCEALEAEPDELLSSTVAMPRISDALRPQRLAVAARVDVVRERLAQLAAHGVRARSVDIADSALRGIARLAPSPDRDAAVVVVAAGPADLGIALLWQGRFAALRSLALPPPHERDAADFAERLALHVQRTVDQFERQATRLAVRGVLTHLPGLDERVRDVVHAALPIAVRRFDLDAALAVAPAAAAALAREPQLAALACVAALRLLDAAAPAASADAPAAVETAQRRRFAGDAADDDAVGVGVGIGAGAGAGAGFGFGHGGGADTAGGVDDDTGVDSAGGGSARRAAAPTATGPAPAADPRGAALPWAPASAAALAAQAIADAGSAAPPLDRGRGDALSGASPTDRGDPDAGRGGPAAAATARRSLVDTP